MIRTLADQYLAQNAGRRYPFRDDTETPAQLAGTTLAAWVSDAAVLDFRCTVRGVPDGAVPEARLVEIGYVSHGHVLFGVALSAGGRQIDTLRFEVPTSAASSAPYTAYATGEAGAAGAITVVTPRNTLPYDEEAAYIAGDGRQYIDTGFKANTTTTRLDIRLALDSPSANMGLFGSRNSSGSAHVSSCNAFLIASSGAFRFDWAEASGAALFDCLPGAEYEISVTGGKVTVNGTTTYYAGRSSVDQTNDFMLFSFAQGSNGAMYPNGMAGKVFYATLYSGDSVVRDLVPVRVGQAGALYDRRGTGGMNSDGTPRSDGLYLNRGVGDFACGDGVSYDVDIPFAATTVVCDSLKVDSLQSVQDPADALDEDDTDGLDATAPVSGEIELAEGRNAEPYLDGNRLRIDVFKGGGLGERCQGVDEDAGQTCGTVLFTVNGERPGSDGELRIVGEDGITVTPYPEDHAVEIRMDDAAAAKMTVGCAPACQKG